MDYIQAAREEGPSLVQDFHESMEQRGAHLRALVADVCAFANTNGGTLYVGVSADPKKPPVGIVKPQESIDVLQREISHLITPELPVEIDVQETQGKPVIRIQVPSGEDRPYAIDDNKFYVRDEAETSLAVRDEIVSLVRQSLVLKEDAVKSEPATPAPAPAATPPTLPEPEAPDKGIRPPLAGVEIVGVEQRGDTRYYIMRDLRNGNIVKNVTLSSARRLWHYAIKQRESNPVRPEKVQWHGDIGLWTRYQKQGETRYDLVQREDGRLRVYYGVTENGMQGAWQMFLAPEEEE
jgi:hypothetical protein